MTLYSPGSWKTCESGNFCIRLLCPLSGFFCILLQNIHFTFFLNFILLIFSHFSLIYCYYLFFFFFAVHSSYRHMEHWVHICRGANREAIVSWEKRCSSVGVDYWSSWLTKVRNHLWSMIWLIAFFVLLLYNSHLHKTPYMLIKTSILYDYRYEMIKLENTWVKWGRKIQSPSLKNSPKQIL